jgi:hypothetical protein
MREEGGRRMTGVMIFVGIWLSLMAAVFASFWIDRIVVFVLYRVDLPLFETAWLVAESIYRHPDEWAVKYGHLLEHPRLGELRAYSVRGLELDGWEPNFIERRIIWDAIEWRRRQLIRKALIDMT